MQQKFTDLADLSAFCARVSGNLDDFGWDDKQLTLEVVGARVVVNGRKYELQGRVHGLTQEGVSSTTRSGGSLPFGEVESIPW